ncbi:hypothetical protein HanIR_Chr08g0387231 [Helianthus annuus]|nr:hypothetical protein HanIR_Chr08g0387231 [Helianthus annuus]
MPCLLSYDYFIESSNLCARQQPCFQVIASELAMDLDLFRDLHQDLCGRLFTCRPLCRTHTDIF